MPSTPMDGPNTLVVEVSEFDGRVATGIERETDATVRFVPSPRTAERINLALSEDRGIVVGMEQDSPSVLSVELA